MQGVVDKIAKLYFFLTMAGIAGQELPSYQNSWLTDIGLNKGNVYKLARAGRCRWRIENECFNTLKNHSYHLEYSYGYGEKNLCFNFC